jgi:plastocyanin
MSSRIDPRAVRRLAPVLAAALGVAFGACAGLAATSHSISQKYRSFHPRQITISQGDIVHIENDDEFTHQAYVESSTFTFESAEQAPGESFDIVFTARGSFMVQCHIHPKMRLDVVVQ